MLLISTSFPIDANFIRPAPCEPWYFLLFGLRKEVFLKEPPNVVNSDSTLSISIPWPLSSIITSDVLPNSFLLNLIWISVASASKLFQIASSIPLIGETLEYLLR